MTGAKDKSEGAAGGRARQDRLKVALRENLKRRKSQANERRKERGKRGDNKEEGKMTDVPSTEAELFLHEEAGKRGG